MDAFTLRHLTAWIESALLPEDREDAFDRMVKAISDDPGLLEMDYPTIWRALNSD